jgi:hypothetical protein
MNKLKATAALACTIAIVLPFAAGVRATDNCGDIDIDLGPALRVIAEECRAQRVDAATCSRIADNAVRRMAAM